MSEDVILLICPDHPETIENVNRVAYETGRVKPRCQKVVGHRFHCPVHGFVGPAHNCGATVERWPMICDKELKPRVC